MENAVKALYISAGVLIAVMILSLAVVLYSNLQGYVEESNNEIKYNEINSFNSKYLNCINYINNEKSFDLTIQDVVTIANSAYENNVSYDLNRNKWQVSENSLYVQVILDRRRIDTLLNIDGSENMIRLLEDNKEKTFKCTPEDVAISEVTGQVCSIHFSTINN